MRNKRSVAAAHIHDVRVRLHERDQHAGKIFLDEFNYAWADPQDVVNFQLGVSNDRWTVAPFVKNLTDEDVGQRMTRQNDTRPSALGSGYPAINGYSQAAAGSQGVAGTARKPRQVGIHAALAF